MTSLHPSLPSPALSRPPDSQDVQVVCADAPFRAGEISVARAVGELLRVVRDSLDLEVVFVGEVNGGRRYFRHLHAPATPAPIEVASSHALAQALCQRILNGRLPALLPDGREIASADPTRTPEIAQWTPHIGVPVHLPDGQLYGMLCGFSLGDRAPLDARDVRRMEVAANAAARLLAQADGSALDASVEMAWA